MHRPVTWAALAWLVVSPPTISIGAEVAPVIEYNRDIRPILAENCFRCHGPDSASRKAGLRLDRREAAVEAGAIAPGDRDASELVHRILATDPDEVMPPPAVKKTLTDSQKQLLTRWIQSGAAYQPHWSLIAPRRPTPPAAADAAWDKNPIDRFLLAALRSNGLSPAPEADRRSLARRLSLDLNGLPPDPAVVEAFVNDTAPDAYESLVDRLLNSSRWGEHRARYWLDAARYADSNGIHFDNYRENWAYRDWVINAFNRNLPFDQFTVDQLAGDLLPGRTLEQQVASGFNRCNITTSEGGAISEEYLVLYTRDRTEATSQVWLGMTAGCAVCHDHKFDPLSQKEFYSLAAFFNNTTQAAMDGNIKDTPPVVLVPRAGDEARWGQLGGALADARQRVESRRQSARAEFDRWVANARPDALAAAIPSDGLELLARLDEGTGIAIGATLHGQPRTIPLGAEAAWEPGHVAAQAFRPTPATVPAIADAGDFERDRPFSFGAWVKLPAGVQNGALFARMDSGDDFRGWDLWLENGRFGSHIIHKWPANALKVVSKAPLATGRWQHLFVTYDGSGKAAGVALYVDGKAQEKEVASDTLGATIRTKVALKVSQRESGSPVANFAIEDLRIYRQALPATEVDRLVKGTRAAWLAAKPVDRRTAAEKDELYGWWLAAIDPAYAQAATAVAALETEQAAIRSRATVAHVMQERNEAAMAYVLFRGDYDKRRDPVTPNTPAALPPLPPDLPRNRLGLARWLLGPEHPLTARVTVNRFWQEVFGTGLVRTAGDFGVSGELPSHPELLDWLAVEFRESGWDVKRLFKTIVTSAAYRQAATATPEALAKDPSNRLLSRGPRFRMDAEMVRDYALAAGGLLAARIGGPSVKPYQPDGVWEAVAMIGSNTRDYRRDRGEDLYRRSLYTFWKRSAPPASMEIFNAPSREACTVRRERTNTPLQALVTLNDPQFIEAARHLAELALEHGGPTAADRARFLALRVLSRPLRPEEERVVDGSLDALLAHYKAHPDDAKALLATGESKADPGLDPAALAGWTMLANEIMNLDEVLNK